MARGALISMVSVIFFLPPMFMAFDRLICKTGIGFRQKKEKQEKMINGGLQV